MRGILWVIRNAKSSVKIIDDNVTSETLDWLIFAGVRVEVRFYSKNRPQIPNIRNYRRRKAFSKGLKFTVTTRFANRYILVDEKFLYILSSSLNKMGKRNFSWIRIMEYEEVEMMARVLKRYDIL